MVFSTRDAWQCARSDLCMVIYGLRNHSHFFSASIAYKIQFNHYSEIDSDIVAE
jgi:hypothetical protein